MTCFNCILYALLAIFIAIYLFFKKNFSFFESRGIPYVLPTIPFGSISGMGTKFHGFDFVIDMYKKYKNDDKICGFFLLTQPIFVVTDGDLLKSITVKDFNSFVNRGFYHNDEGEPLTANMVNLEDNEWRFIRNKLSPVFTSGKIKAMCGVIQEKQKNLVYAIETASKVSQSVDVREITNRFTIDIISSVAFGMEANTLNHENELLITLMKDVFGMNNFKFFFANEYPKLAKFIGIRIFGKAVSDFFTETVANNIKYREETNDSRSDFLNMLIQLKNKGSIDGEFSTETKKLTFNEILAEAFVFFFGGSDTASASIAFTLVLLAHNQDIQERLRAEIEEKTKATKGEITYEALMEMHYLNQVVNETLRMYPPGFILQRKASNDYKVPNSNHVIPKGSSVWIPVAGFHYDENYFKNPHKFDPDRFSAEENAKRPSFVFSPFGEGPRNCIGMRFALVNVKYGITMIVKNFRILSDPKMIYPIKIHPKKVQLEAVGGFKARFERI